MRKFNQRKLWPAKIAIKNAPKIKTNSFFVIVLTLTLKINNPEKSEIVYSASFCYESMPFIVIQIDIAFFTYFAIFRSLIVREVFFSVLCICQLCILWAKKVSRISGTYSMVQHGVIDFFVVYGVFRPSFQLFPPLGAQTFVYLRRTDNNSLTIAFSTSVTSFFFCVFVKNYSSAALCATYVWIIVDNTHNILFTESRLFRLTGSRHSNGVIQLHERFFCGKTFGESTCRLCYVKWQPIYGFFFFFRNYERSGPLQSTKSGRKKGQCRMAHSCRRQAGDAHGVGLLQNARYQRWRHYM